MLVEIPQGMTLEKAIRFLEEAIVQNNASVKPKGLKGVNADLQGNVVSFDKRVARDAYSLDVNSVIFLRDSRHSLEEVLSDKELSSKVFTFTEFLFLLGYLINNSDKFGFIERGAPKPMRMLPWACPGSEFQDGGIPGVAVDAEGMVFFVWLHRQNTVNFVCPLSLKAI